MNTNISAGRKSIDLGIESIRLRMLSELYDALSVFDGAEEVKVEALFYIESDKRRYKIELDLKSDEAIAILKSRIEDREKEK